MQRRVFLSLVSTGLILGCEEENPEMALKSTGAVVSRVDGRTMLHFEHLTETDLRLKRINFQLGVSFVRIGAINFDDSDATDRGIESLDQISDLEVLHIRNCRNVTNRSMKFLAQNPKLIELTVVETRCTDDGFAPIASLTNLERLEISGVGEKTLSHIGRLRNLDRLTLIDSKINEAGARSLGRVTSLRVLEFYRCTMKDTTEYQVRRALPQCRISIIR